MNACQWLVSMAAATAAHLVAQTPTAPAWQHLGGGATVHDASPNAFSMPAPLLSPSERRAFVVGNSFFKQNWVTAPASTADRDGLGPLFNARSCSTCHFKDGRSRPPEDGEADRSGLLIRIGVPARQEHRPTSSRTTAARSRTMPFWAPGPKPAS
jgi:CxxC motif-containing protein (DUF1111 family)